MGTSSFFIDHDPHETSEFQGDGRPIASSPAPVGRSATRIVKSGDHWIYADEVPFQLLNPARKLPTADGGEAEPAFNRYEADFEASDDQVLGWTLCSLLTPHSNGCMGQARVRRGWRQRRHPLPDSVRSAGSDFAMLQALEALDQDWWATSSKDRVAGWSIWQRCSPISGKVRSYRVRGEAGRSFVEGERKLAGPSGLEPCWCFGICAEPDTVVADVLESDELRGLREVYERDGIPWRSRGAGGRRQRAQDPKVREDLAAEAGLVVTMAARLALAGKYDPWPCDDSNRVATYACVIAERLSPTVAKHHPVLKEARRTQRTLDGVAERIRKFLAERGEQARAIETAIDRFQSPDPHHHEQLLRALKPLEPSDALLGAIVKAWAARRQARWDARRDEGGVEAADDE